MESASRRIEMLLYASLEGPQIVLSRKDRRHRNSFLFLVVRLRNESPNFFVRKENVFTVCGCNLYDMFA